MRYRIKPLKTYRPSITMEQICAFDINRPETYTESRLVNEVCKMLTQLDSKRNRYVGYYMGVSQAHLNGALILETGHSLMEIRRVVNAVNVGRFIGEHPEMKADEVAKHFGYTDRRAIWRLMNSIGSDMRSILKSLVDAKKRQRKIARLQSELSRLREEETKAEMNSSENNEG